VLGLALAAGQVGMAQGRCGDGSQPPCTDVYTVDYYANANTLGAPDGTLRVLNPGSATAAIPGCAPVHGPNGPLGNCVAPVHGPNTPLGKEGLDACALIYVFDAKQELSECCGCFVSANGLMTLSVNADLVSNPLLGTKLRTGVIKIVSSLPNDPCDPTSINLFSTDANLTLRAWSTHIQNKVGVTYPETEGESQAAPLGLGELTDLEEDCTVLRELGSGAGACSCDPCVPPHGPSSGSAFRCH
jgi:hypothetical protein